MIQRDIIVRTSSARFTTTYQALNCEDVTCIDVTIFLLFQEFTDFCIFINNYLVFAIIEDLVETIDEMQEADYFFVTYGNVTGSFVSHVYVMLLFYQAADCTTHGDYVIIGMRREYDDTFRIRFRTFGTISIVCIWFTARPSSDGVLQIVEDLDIHIICRTKQSQQFAQTIFIVILVC